MPSGRVQREQLDMNSAYWAFLKILAIQISFILKITYVRKSEKEFWENEWIKNVICLSVEAVWDSY